jgi:hypothetical protein
VVGPPASHSTIASWPSAAVTKMLVWRTSPNSIGRSRSNTAYGSSECSSTARRSRRRDQSPPSRLLLANKRSGQLRTTSRRRDKRLRGDSNPTSDHHILKRFMRWVSIVGEKSRLHSLTPARPTLNRLSTVESECSGYAADAPNVLGASRG